MPFIGLHTRTPLASAIAGNQAHGDTQMSQSNEMIAAKPSQIDAQSVPATTTRPGQVIATAVAASVKDAGRVHFGAGLMRF